MLSPHPPWESPKNDIHQTYIPTAFCVWGGQGCGVLYFLGGGGVWGGFNFLVPLGEKTDYLCCPSLFATLNFEVLKILKF